MAAAAMQYPLMTKNAGTPRYPHPVACSHGSAVRPPSRRPTTTCPAWYTTTATLASPRQASSDR